MRDQAHADEQEGIPLSCPAAPGPWYERAGQPWLPVKTIDKETRFSVVDINGHGWPLCSHLTITDGKRLLGYRSANRASYRTRGIRTVIARRGADA